MEKYLKKIKEKYSRERKQLDSREYFIMLKDYNIEMEDRDNMDEEAEDSIETDNDDLYSDDGQGGAEIAKNKERKDKAHVGKIANIIQSNQNDLLRTTINEKNVGFQCLTG